MNAAPPHLLHVFSTFVPAGPELRTVRLIEALGTEYRHSILAIDGRTDAFARFTPEAPVRRLPSPPRAGTPTTARRLLRLMRAVRPDLVLTYNWGAFDGVLAARLARLPVLHHEDGFTPDEVAGQKRRRVWARRAVLRGVYRVVVPSRVLHRIATQSWRLPAERVALVPNGVELERFRAQGGGEQVREELDIKPDAFVVAFVGHLRPEKNPLRLLEAAARVPPEARLVLLLVGEGPERERLEERARREDLAGRVRFAGQVRDVPRLLAAADAFALSSDTEQQPVALLEAMAAALPVAATDVGDVRATLPREQAPWVVAAGAGCEERLAGVLAAFARNRDLCARLGAANRARCESEFAFERMAERYHALYRGGIERGSF